MKIICHILVILFYSQSSLGFSSENSLHSEHKYFLCVSSIFKDEAPWLKEWIEYHKLLGVQHFRLYNNHSTDHYLEVLNPYMKSGEVTVIDWPGGHGNWCYEVQGFAMLDAINHFKGVSKWLALIDIDEFMLPTEYPDMISFLNDYEPFAAVVINWQNYGTSWVQDIPKDKLMIEVLTLKAEEQNSLNRQVKSIVQPKLTDTSKQDWTPHQWCYLPGFLPVSPAKDRFTYGCIDISKIRINHYIHRTENYFYHCKLAKKAIMEQKLSLAFVEQWHRSCNVVEDKAIFRFIPALREKIFPKEP
jgi:hypothetical protein